MPLRSVLTSSLAVALVALTGCRINHRQAGDGRENVDIDVPFGSVQVKTDSHAASAQTGLTPYPGATLVRRGKDNDGAADISLNVGKFQMGVHAVELQTADPADKVLDFYKKDLARYGDVLTCHGSAVEGTPVRTSAGLTCGSGEEHASDHHAGGVELRAGSESHQHVAGVRTEDGATRIGLIALDFPNGWKHGDGEHRRPEDRE